MTRSLSRTTLLALALVSLSIPVACGEAQPTTPAPKPAPAVEETTPAVPAPAKEAPVAEEPVVDAAPETVPETPVVTPPAEEPAGAAAELVDRLGPLRDMVAKLGLELSDADLQQVAGYVDGAVTEENVKQALQKFGASDPEGAAGALAEKIGVDIPGLRGSGDGDPKPTAAEAAADAVGQGAGAMTKAEIRAERVAAVAAMEAKHEQELADLRKRITERIARNPAKTAELQKKLSEKEAALAEEQAAELKELRAGFKKRMRDAR